MIKLMDPKEDPLPPELSLVGLKLFRKIIEKENHEMYTPAADWETADYIIYAPKIKERQDELVHLGLDEIVYDLLSLDVNIELKHEAILVGISLLLDGNAHAQKALHSRLSRDTKNSFVYELQLLIENSFALIKRFSDRMIKYREEIMKKNIEDTFMQDNVSSF
jgi:hypothetical protein